MGRKDYRFIKPTNLEKRISQLKDWLVLMINTPNAPIVHGTKDETHIEIRSEATRLLGRLGDPRPGVGVKDNLPDITWVTIPKGTYEISKPGTPETTLIPLDSFQMSKYPVTYAQYALFVEAKGYQHNEFWSAAGREWKRGQNDEPLDWNNPSWHVGNHPVVNISWYEAEAYCAWLNSIMPEKNVHLPSHAQWEAAAHGLKIQPYTYGDTFSATAANGRLTHIERTSAVGLFSPQGDSPLGIADMSGNVYDWCSDIHTDDLDTTKNKEGSSKDFALRRMLCGGSWLSYPGFLTTTSAFAAYPYLTNTYWGFRLVYR